MIGLRRNFCGTRGVSTGAHAAHGSHRRRKNCRGDADGCSECRALSWLPRRERVGESVAMRIRLSQHDCHPDVGNHEAHRYIRLPSPGPSPGRGRGHLVLDAFYKFSRGTFSCFEFSPLWHWSVATRFGIDVAIEPTREMRGSPCPLITVR